MNLLKRFIREEDGLETVEYAIMTALIVAGVLTAIGLLAGAVETRFTDTATTVSGAGGGGGGTP